MSQKTFEKRVFLISFFYLNKTFNEGSFFVLRGLSNRIKRPISAPIAQLVEQLICNQ